MGRVFLSYAREDVGVAKKLAACVGRAGHSVWWDHDIQGGSHFASEIDKELKAADAVVVLWSKTAVDSPWVQDEAAEGRDSGRLVPVIMGADKPPLGFRQFQSIDFSGWDGTDDEPPLTALVAALAQKCGEAQPKNDVQHPAAKASERRMSICVLPFANMSGDPEQEYFSDGISEDIITDLSKVSALSVIARNTAFTFKGQSVDVKDVAKALGVDHVLEGSVRKAGNRVRITAQLIDGKAGDHLWADRYDRDLTDIFEIQDEISKEIVRALKVRLLPEEEQAIESRGTENAQAYNLYLMARQQWVWGSWGNSRRDEIIVRICKQAVVLDPDYADAWALMALAQAELRFWHGKEDDDPLPSAERALEINPKLAAAHAVRVRHFEQQGDFDRADKELENALSLGPDSWEVNREAARLMFGRNRMGDAARYYAKSAELMDTDFHSCLMLQTCYMGIGEHSAALDVARQTVDRAELALAKDPTNGAALAAGASSLILLGETERSRDWTDRALLLDPENLSIRYNVACSLAIASDLNGALDLLGQYFDRVVSAANIRHAEIDPDMDPVREDARFKAMVAAAKTRLGIPVEAHA